MHERTVRARTATGIVEGFTRDGVHRWRSIPYARAPVGSLRFRAPQPAQPWPGVRHCHTFANCAPQQRRYTVMGIGRYQTRSEDCLTLNVVTPEEPATQPLPVMVFIHGGGYILGSSATPIYDGAALARRGCVYVSVNYRLGALGCLDLSSLSTPQITLDSNVYLRDLVLALRWVHDNIAEFGGDPGNVTIFGESAGAHITATLLAVPAAKGLFARAISESPAAGMVRSREVAAEFAARFANLIGDFCEGGSLAVTGGAALARAISDYLAEAADYHHVVATKDFHIDPGDHFSGTPDYSSSWPPHCVSGTPGADFHPSLDTSAIEAVFYKGAYTGAYSGFEGVDENGTPLLNWLRQRGVDEVDVVGIATDHCVRQTAEDAVRNGLATRVLVDLTAGVSADTTVAALEEMRTASVELVCSS